MLAVKPPNPNEGAVDVVAGVPKLKVGWLLLILKAGAALACPKPPKEVVCADCPNWKLVVEAAGAAVPNEKGADVAAGCVEPNENGVGAGLHSEKINKNTLEIAGKMWSVCDLILVKRVGTKRRLLRLTKI